MLLSHEQQKAAEILRQAGIFNPCRLVSLIRKTIAFLELNLSGLTVLTEAASGSYVVTALIAAAAGAKRVLALTRDSRYGTVEQVIAQTRALETLLGIEGAVEIYSQRSPDLFKEADIVTNLGFVRPIDAEAISAMKPTAVVPLMCEAWEIRPGDVDVDACRTKGILVMGTNEDFPGLDVFSYSGWLCFKMLFDAQIEIHKSQIVVVSRDKFGRVIEHQLFRDGASVHLLSSLRDASLKILAEADVLIVADYACDKIIIGDEGDMTADALAQAAPFITVIQFAGRIDAERLRHCGIAVYPHEAIGAHRMGSTLAELSPRPVVELHAAGLKVGQSLTEIQQCNQPGPTDPLKCKSASYSASLLFSELED